MRPSSRTAILGAAVRLAERSGIGSLTLDAAAAESGLSKGGLIYHFPSKESLMLGVVEYITEGWEAEMLAELGIPFEQAGPAQRVRAYTRVITGTAAARADLAVLVDSVHHEALQQPWRDLLARWVGEPKSTVDSQSVDRAVARLAADGLWLAEASATGGLGKRMRAAVLARIEALAAGKGSA